MRVPHSIQRSAIRDIYGACLLFCGWSGAAAGCAGEAANPGPRADPITAEVALPPDADAARVREILGDDPLAVRVLRSEILVYDNDIIGMIAACANLESLSIAMEYHRDDPRLREIKGHITRDMLLRLSALEHLRTLRFLNRQSMEGRLAGVWAAFARNSPGLRELEVANGWRNVGLGAEDFDALARCPELSHLTAQVVVPIEDETLSRLARGCPGLRTLILRDTGIAYARYTRAGVEALAACADLTALELPLPARVRDDFFDALVRAAPRLERLTLLNDGVEDRHLAAFARLERLREIHLPSAEDLTDEGLAGLAGTALVEIHIPRAPGLSDKGLAALGDLSTLRVLALSGARRVTDAGLEAAAAQFPALERLALDGNPAITGTGLRALRALKHLTTVALYSDTSGLTDADLAILPTFPNLRAFWYSAYSGGITREAVAAFSEQHPRIALRCPMAPLMWPNMKRMAENARVDADQSLFVAPDMRFDEFARRMDERRDWRLLYVQRQNIDDAWLTRIAEQPELESLNLAPAQLHAAFISDFSSTAFRGLAACTKLKSLRVCNARPLADADVAAVVDACPDLEQLDLADYGPAGIGPLTMAAIGRHPRLNDVQFRRTAAMAAPAFAAWTDESAPALTRLTIANAPGITPDMARRLVQNRPDFIGWLNGHRYDPPKAAPQALPAEPPDVF